MSIFDNYTDLRSSYIPNNTEEKLSDRRLEYPTEVYSPREEHNLRGEFIGYSWNYGDTMNLVVDVNPKVMVESDAIIYTDAGEGPDENTYGEYGRMAYNTFDLIAWKCVTKDKAHFVWEEQEKLTVPVHGTKEEHFQLFKNLESGMYKINFKIYNFRWEEQYETECTAYTDTILVNISSELSAKLVKGIYYTSTTVFVENEELGKIQAIEYGVPIIVH